MNPVTKGKNHFYPDKKAHIEVNPDIDPEIFDLLTQVCPAGLYWRDENGFHHDYIGCLECGACRIIGDDVAFRQWTYPEGGTGVDFSRDGASEK